MRGAALALAPLALLVGVDCGVGPDPVLGGDPVDPAAGLVYEIVLRAPRIADGPGREFETADDVVSPEIKD